MPHATTTFTIKAKMGKVIKVTYKDDNPDIAEFVIKSNRGTIKDTLEVPAKDVMELSKTITIINAYYNKEE